MKKLLFAFMGFIIVILFSGCPAAPAVNNFCSIKLFTLPANIDIRFDSENCKSPKTFQINSGTMHTLGVLDTYSDCSSYISGDDVKYIFDKWNDENNQNPRAVVVSSDITYTASMKTQYKVKVETFPENISEIPGSSWYDLNATCSFVAPELQGYFFNHWEVNAINVGVEDQATITIDSPKKVIAFYDASYSIEADNEVHKTGKWSEITVKVKDRFGNPAEGVRVSFGTASQVSMISAAFHDSSRVEIEPIVITDSNGIATLSGFFENSEEFDYRAYLTDYHNISKTFHVSVLSAEWMFFVWMGADNNLESAAVSDLVEMAVDNPCVSIFGIADVSSLEIGDGQFPGIVDDFVFILDENGEMYMENLDFEVDSGLANSLESFLANNLGIEANHKSLILWNHGGAWLDEAAQRERGIIYDDTNDSFLKIADVESALVDSLNGETLDILGMDACLMSTMEVAYQLKSTADYFVASAFSEPGDGWNYTFIDDINSSSNSLDISKFIIDRYFDQLSYLPELSLSAWDLTKMNELYTSLDNFSYSLNSILDEGIRERIMNLYYPYITKYHSYEDYDILVELGDFLGFVYYDEGISQEVSDKTEAVWNCLEEVITYNKEVSGTSNSKGVSIYFPSSKIIFDGYYSNFLNLDFKDNYWKILISNILDPDYTLQVDLNGPEYYGNVLLVSNESTDGNSAESVETLMNNVETEVIPKGLPLEAYRYDYLPDLPENAKFGDLYAAPLTRETAIYNVGDTRSFWVSNIKTSEKYLLQATLQSIGTKCQIWVENTTEIDIIQAIALSEEFDNIIYPLISSDFYEPSDVNADGKVAILCFDIQDDFETTGSICGGYFSPVDLFDSSNYPNSNEMEIFYIDTYPSMHNPVTDPVDVSDAYSTLAHEFQHMVNFNRNYIVEESHTSMDIWLNEGLSMAAEHIYQGVLESRINYYNNSESIKRDGHSLLHWDYEGDTLSNYSLSYLFGQYFRTQCLRGNSIFKEILEDPDNDYRCIENVVKKYIDSDLEFGRFMTYFRLALLLKNPSGLYGFNGDSNFDAINNHFSSSPPSELPGGGAFFYPISDNPFEEPSDSGSNIKYVGINME